MKKDDKNIRIINSVSELHRLLSLSKPSHPLITLINHSDVATISDENKERLLLNFYNISIKRSFQGQMKYGKNYYDFDEGTMSFVAPNQVIAMDDDENRDKEGWSLLFHHDLIRNYPLGKTIKNYGYFSYEINEALHLSDEEEKIIESLVQNIQKEYQSRIDTFSQDVIVANLELLLNYCNRFYNRQFVTRKMANNDLLSKFENLLSNYFEDNSKIGLPTVTNLAEQLHLSPSYLSDMLRTVTGQNTQQHIHNKLIEKAKDVLTTTNLSVSQIAFELGFEYPQSFSKLFKAKSGVSPLEYRKSFN
ncbi:helix-turn-helix domain-containing protein [Flavobacterium turcicum]|uniref:Helix-turn-helix transcriptional regulator n=1 Tax=Flavobacterium turcicum TaxID=2764718 RepID=A0ABR7JEA3_9FLAO|nr:helix-turn-helix transcriptional regulator [Flavobacterium turcicum]MBC5862812.1 helix-turn-helix transcriptional regulator [Flavobacterium turcicum]NHL01544.1 helix-turn-helix transcriptional regulator [Flavobacterium turcicum]